MLKCDLPGGREVADLPSKGPYSQSAPEGGTRTMSMKIMMIRIIRMMIVMVMMFFFSLQTIVFFLGF